MYPLFCDWTAVSEASASGRTMKGVAEPKTRKLSGLRCRGIAPVLWLALPLMTVFCVLCISAARPRASALTIASDDESAKANLPLADYSKFSHAGPKEHADLMARASCASCHRRSDGSLEPTFPIHKDCTGCHLVQFTASNNSSSVNPICTICHKPEGLNSSNAPLKHFPRLLSFAAEFDHAQHLKGIESARPVKGCAACHTPANRGVAESIPTRLNAHQVCYDCHSPGKSASKTSSCGSCHRLGSYSATSIAARSYRLGFSHADHGPRERLSCDRCHDVRGRGLPQARQVSSTLPVQHLVSSRAQNCITCHNGQRAFGVNANFTECSRCHKRTGFGSGE